ncbi:MAG: DUF4861 family protein [Breznakibacter sp.]
MKQFLLIVSACLGSSLAMAQNKTDVSLLWKDTLKQVSSVSSGTGDLYRKLHHHGPAVENEWVAYRFYFDKKVSIDVYNKQRKQLELKAATWYPTPEQQKKGWGSDQYKVAQTVGLGGVRLWDGEKEVLLNPVEMRTAKVSKEGSVSYMEMWNEGVPYKGGKVDILVRVTVYSGIREAKVEAFALTGEPVQFFTGINYFDKTPTKQGNNYILTWGLHPEDVAAFPLNIGAALKYNPSDFEKVVKGPAQYEMVSKPTKYLELWITSACEKEKAFPNMAKFEEYVADWAR